MKEFSPSIESRETDELIAIAHSSTNEYQEEAIELAKIELKRRNISIQEQKAKIKEWEKQSEKIEQEYLEKLDENQYESYTILKMVKIFFLAPFYLTGKFFADDRLLVLRKENYKKKFKQRIILLITGTAFWIGLCLITFKISENSRLKEIEKVDISEWEKNRIDNSKKDTIK